MSFVSIEFAFVALVFFPLYWGLRETKNLQMFFLVVSGYLLFATWSWISVVALFGLSVYVWLAGKWINSGDGERKLPLAMGIFVSVLALLFFKYYEFVRLSASEVMQNIGLQIFLPVIDVVAPVGISFFIFQALSYLVWQREIPHQQTSFMKLLLFLSFWPTHFAGPIFRAKDFFGQLESKEFGAPLHLQRAIYFILLGLAEKMVFANWLENTFVDEAFKYPETQTVVSSLAAVMGYSLQIFLDFSGYTLIVTGLGLLLGFTLPVNFRQPYLAVSLRDFWRRWHISLSSFIRDYIYIPLGGNRNGFLRAQTNLMAVMLISGLWHGANFTFLAWGALHGFGVVCQNVIERLFGKNLSGVFSHALTFMYVSFAWIFFRSESVESAWLMIGGLERELGEITPQHFLLMAFTLLFFLLSMRSESLQRGIEDFIGRWRGWRLTSAVTLSVFLIIMFGPSGVPGFIYYRF